MEIDPPQKIIKPKVKGNPNLGRKGEAIPLDYIKLAKNQKIEFLNDRALELSYTALERMGELMVDPNAKDTVQLEASKSIMDRALGRPVSAVAVDQNVTTGVKFAYVSGFNRNVVPQEVEEDESDSNN